MKTIKETELQKNKVLQTMEKAQLVYSKAI